MRRGLVLWLVLLAAYAATLGAHASDSHRYTAAEAHLLLQADSIAHDGDIDLLNQYRKRAWRAWYSGPLRPPATLTKGRLVEPPAAGFPLLIAPAMAVGGPTLVQLWCAALVALGFVLASLLGRELVPDPWGWWAALVVGLSPPVLAAATRVSPELVGGALLAGAALLALRARERVTRRATFGCAALLAFAPWLALELVVPALVIAFALWRWLRRGVRGTAGIIALEIVLTSVVLYVTINERLYGGFTPYASGPAGGPTRLHDAGDLLARLPRIVAVFVDRDVGLLRWAPFLGLVFLAVWLLWRSRRDRLSAAIPDQADVEAAAILLMLVCAAVIAVEVIAAPVLHGPWFAARHALPALPAAAALCAWGLRFAPRAGAALAAVTLIGSVWLLVAIRADSSTALAPAHGPLPWAGLQNVVLARFGDTDTVGEIVWLVVAVAAVAAVVFAGLRLGRGRGVQAAEDL
jgi:hypothetical protein